MSRLSPQRILRGLAQRFIHGPRGGGKPVPETALDAEYTGGNWDHFFDARELPRYAALTGLVRAHAVQPPRLLDVGCGSGRLATQFRPGELGAYLGVDLSREGLQRAEKLGIPGARFAHGDFETWRSGEVWDVIVFNEVIGYARDPGATVAAFLPALAPGGVLIVSLYRWGNHAAIWRRIGRNATVLNSLEIQGPPGVIWDIKVLAKTAS
ncbi:MAG: methyltransferase domain-containing protein [Opitutaceae bacterium]|jgi:trans-aconitate methyltransferase